MSALLPDETKDQVSRLLFRRDFGPSYRLECQNLFADFAENVEFRFSLGFTALMNRFLGPKNTRVAMAGFANVVSQKQRFVTILSKLGQRYYRDQRRQLLTSQGHQFITG